MEHYSTGLVLWEQNRVACRIWLRHFKDWWREKLLPELLCQFLLDHLLLLCRGVAWENLESTPSNVNTYLFLFYVRECFPCMYVCVLRSCVVPTEFRGRHPISRNGSYRHLWTTMWVPRTEPWSSARTESALNHWVVISSSNIWFLIMPIASEIHIDNSINSEICLMNMSVI